MLNGLPLLIVFTVMIVLMVTAIARFKIHPFPAIMGTALLLGLAALPLSQVPGVIGSGFAGIFSSLGLVIITGALIGTILEKTGAAMTIADAVVRIVGKKHPDTAMILMGWIVSIPVFCDSGYVILNPVRKALARRTGTPAVSMAIALGAGLYTSHVFLPPTPGPIAATQFLGMENNMLTVIGVGVLISIPVLLAGLLYAKYIGRRITVTEENADSRSYEELKASFGTLPGVFSSFTPILLPILLMALKSVVDMTGAQGYWVQTVKFTGTPVIALVFGLLSAIITLGSSGKWSEFTPLTENTLKTVGPILFVTAGGGVLGKVISSAGIVDYITSCMPGVTTLGVIFPFLMAALLKTAQGSSTVAITTTAGIMGVYSAEGSLMASLGLGNPLSAALTVMAIGAGAMTVSHANDSYFWVVTNFSGLKPQEGYRAHTMCTLFMGLTGIAAIFLINLFAN